MGRLLSQLEQFIVWYSHLLFPYRDIAEAAPLEAPPAGALVESFYRDGSLSLLDKAYASFAPGFDSP